MRAKVDRIFSAALALPSEERGQFLSDACRGDQTLEKRVQRLLHASDAPDPVLEPGGAQKGPLWEEFTASLAARDEVRQGTRVGSYRVIREIGRGGMAVVYLAERADGQFEQRVALKVLKPGTDEVIRRFEQERQILASLGHPAIARLLDGGTTDDGLHFLIMEYVDGQPIDLYCDERRLTIEQRLRFFLAVAQAVQYAHGNLVVHRDLKPSNILITRDGQVKLLDFGIAKLLDENGHPHAAPATRADSRPMTPEYASPEQVRGEQMTTASDVYQLGLLLYELLTARRPYRFSGATLGEVERMICEQAPALPSVAAGGENEAAGPESKPPSAVEVAAARSTRPERLRRRLRGDLDLIILTALRKRPERRYATAEQLCLDIERHLAGQPVAARRDNVTYRVWKFVQRHTAAVYFAVSMLLLVAGLTGFYTVRLASERNRAEQEAETATQVASFLKRLFEFSDPAQSKGAGMSALELLDRGAAWTESELAGQPEIRAEMMTVLGDIYRKLGHYDRAEPLLQQAAILRGDLTGSARSDLASSLNALALLFVDQGRYSEAEPLSERALDIEQEILGPDHIDVAVMANSLANLYLAQGRHLEAEALCRRALAIREKALGPDHPEVAASLNNLGGIYYEQGKYDEAEHLFNRVLRIRERNLGADHIDVAVSLNNLSVIYQNREQHDRAEPPLVRAHAIWEKALGPDHPRVARVLNNLAALYARQGRADEAESSFRRALAIRERSLGAEHPEVASILRNLALLCSMRGRYEEAEALNGRALAIAEDSLGPDHPGMAWMLRGLAVLYRDQGKHGEAGPLFERALRIQEKALGTRHPSVGVTLSGLAVLRAEQGRYDAAEPLFERALDILQPVHGPEDQRVAAAVNGLARLYIRQARYEEAKDLYEGRLTIAGRRRGEVALGFEQRIALASTLVGLGEVYQKLGDTPNARASWIDAVALIRESGNGSDVVESLDLHATALLNLGRVDEARPMVEKLFATGWKRRGLFELCEQHGVPHAPWEAPRPGVWGGGLAAQ